MSLITLSMWKTGRERECVYVCRERGWSEWGWLVFNVALKLMTTEQRVKFNAHKKKTEKKTEIKQGRVNEFEIYFCVIIYL